MIKKCVLFLCVISMCVILTACGLKHGNVRANNLEEYKVYETKSTEEYVEFINQMNESKESEIVKIVSNENNNNEMFFLVTYKPYEEKDKKYKYSFLNIYGQEEYISFLDETKYEIVDVFSHDYKNFYVTYREEV